jgi:hypothetical protein
MAARGIVGVEVSSDMVDAFGILLGRAGLRAGSSSDGALVVGGMENWRGRSCESRSATRVQFKRRQLPAGVPRSINANVANLSDWGLASFLLVRTFVTRLFFHPIVLIIGHDGEYSGD